MRASALDAKSAVPICASEIARRSWLSRQRFRPASPRPWPHPAPSAASAPASASATGGCAARAAGTRRACCPTRAAEYRRCRRGRFSAPRSRSGERNVHRHRQRDAELEQHPLAGDRVAGGARGTAMPAAASTAMALIAGTISHSAEIAASRPACRATSSTPTATPAAGRNRSRPSRTWNDAQRQARERRACPARSRARRPATARAAP